MAFKSIGQKYGFVSAGDVYRQRIAEERQKAEFERQKAEAERQKAESERQKAEAERLQDRDDTKTVLRNMGMSEEQIAEMQSRLEALRQSRLAQK